MSEKIYEKKRGILIGDEEDQSARERGLDGNIFVEKKVRKFRGLRN